MARVTGGPRAHARHKKIIRMAKGSRGRAKNCFTVAVQRVEKDLQYAYRDRRVNKRNFRALWIQRINAAVRENGLRYSEFMHGIKLAGIDMDRKVLAGLAAQDPAAFKAILTQVQQVLAKDSKSAA